MTVFHGEPPSSLSAPQIHFDHALIRRNLIDGALRQHRAFVQTGDLDAELADKGHVVLDHHHGLVLDRKSTRLNSSHGYISYAVFCLKKKKPVLPSGETLPFSLYPYYVAA